MELPLVLRVVPPPSSLWLRPKGLTIECYAGHGLDLAKYRAASIWWKRFGVNFGAAALRPAEAMQNHWDCTARQGQPSTTNEQLARLRQPADQRDRIVRLKTAGGETGGGMGTRDPS